MLQPKQVDLIKSELPALLQAEEQKLAVSRGLPDLRYYW